ncbi:hypothetical protein [Methylocapsa palsarum]|uniref:Lipoprotein n=1 Tax=Methylocapsa palsarum TaxID=1612308 RepID=A0A1I3Z945_9HYPH|nr:hypothetical protein [Methylocapsa palsarum]SFK40146.1 hypothetical protein SAMN05444581_107139 [Methylocapsa palsarum]
MKNLRLLCAAAAALTSSLALGACTPDMPVSVDRTMSPQAEAATGAVQTNLLVKGVADVVTITSLAANHGTCVLTAAAVSLPYTLKAGDVLQAQANCADPVLEVETSLGTWTFTFPHIVQYFT